MLPPLMFAAAFLSVALAVVGMGLLLAQSPLRVQNRVIARRLEGLLAARRRTTRRPADLYKPELLSDSAPARDLLARLPRARSIQLALRQADWRIPVMSFVLRSASLGAGALGLVVWMWDNPLLGVFAGTLAACGPYLYLTHRRARRFDKLVHQLPEAVDLVARSVRAGHAVAVGFEMVSQEMEPPVADELRQVYEEQKYGIPLQQALLGFLERVPMMDVRMLVTAIVLQRSVGGNLAEVLDKIGRTIRERLKIRRQIRVFTAQGRLSGYVLVALPGVMVVGLSILNPNYLRVLTTRNAGMLMVGVSVLLQILGYFWIRKIINIKI